MALINRISRLFQADMHAVLDNIEEPEVLLRQAIREMEDDLSATEQRIRVAAHDQETLAARCSELDQLLGGIDGELDLCFASEKDELAKNLIRRKLESQRLLKSLSGKHSAAGRILAEARDSLDDKRTTLEGLRQKAELFAARPPAAEDSEFDDIGWMARDLRIGDDEVEIAYLREKQLRNPS